MSRNASKELKVGAAKRAPLAEQARGPHEVGEPTPELTPLRRDPLAGLPAPPPSAASVAGHAARLVRATGGRLSRAGGALHHLQRQYGNRYVGRVIAQARAVAPARPALAVEPKLVLDAQESKAPGAGSGTTRMRQENKTGLPDNLKAGIEALSGLSMDDVKVHYNSSKPAQLGAVAYAQGTDIHVAPGQDRHLPHEAWHVVQQKQGRVKPTVQARGVAINDDQGLEKEADVLGTKALQMMPRSDQVTTALASERHASLQRQNSKKSWVPFSVATNLVIQRIVDSDLTDALRAIDITEWYVANTVPELKHAYPDWTKRVETVNATVAKYMAEGLKAWAQNFENKSIAYLLEARKALDHTELRRGKVAALGVNTMSDPDVSELRIVDEEYLLARSLEIKSSHSGHDAVAELVREGLEQLKKREIVGNTFGVDYADHLLVVNLNNPCNYPFTDREFEAFRARFQNPYDFEDFVVQSAWNDRLAEKIAQKVSDLAFNKPVEVRMQYRGSNYAMYRTI
jgi:hypothetical protein